MTKVKERFLIHTNFLTMITITLFYSCKNNFSGKKFLQRLPIALAQVKAGNASKNVLNEIRQTIYSLYRAKEITKDVYSNTINFFPYMLA